MTVKDDTSAFLNAPQAYWATAERGGKDGSRPPRPQNRDVAWDVATLCAKSIAALLDYQKTGVLPDAGPSLESKLEAAAIIQRQ